MRDQKYVSRTPGLPCSHLRTPGKSFSYPSPAKEKPRTAKRGCKNILQVQDFCRVLQSYIAVWALVQCRNPFKRGTGSEPIYCWPHHVSCTHLSMPLLLYIYSDQGQAKVGMAKVVSTEVIPFEVVLAEVV